MARVRGLYFIGNCSFAFGRWHWNIEHIGAQLLFEVQEDDVALAVRRGQNDFPSIFGVAPEHLQVSALHINRRRGVIGGKLIGERGRARQGPGLKPLPLCFRIELPLQGIDAGLAVRYHEVSCSGALADWQD